MEFDVNALQILPEAEIEIGLHPCAPTCLDSCWGSCTITCGSIC